VSTVGCARCFAVCPFSMKNRSLMHNSVAATISATPLLNGFFTKMHTVMGYETPKDIEGWWDLNLPPYGIETTKGTQLE
jgi:Fe-S-cluster-containing hydrogenase component 2